MRERWCKLQNADLLNRLPCAFCHDAIQIRLVIHDFLGLDLNVNSLSTGASQRLMDHDSGIGHAETLALGARCQQECTHGCCQAEAVCGDISSTHLQHTLPEIAASTATVK